MILPPLLAPRPPRAKARPLPCPRIGAWEFDMVDVVCTVWRVWCVLLVSDDGTENVLFVKVLKSARRKTEMSKFCFAIVGSRSICMLM